MASDDLQEQVAQIDGRLTSLEDELKNLEGLLVLLAQKFGATTAEIGTVLGIDASGVSRKYPSSGVKSAEVKVNNLRDGG